MKKLLIVLLPAIIIGLALNAQAADFPFNPGMEPPPPSPGFPPPPGSFPPGPGDISCIGFPDISDIEISPENLWAPSGKEVPIEIKGKVSPALDCGISSASYTMEGEGGSVQGNIDLGTEGGSFNETIMVSLSKDGRFKEGTTYRGTIAAEDTAGHKTTVGFWVTVLHDKGKKVGLKK